MESRTPCVAHHMYPVVTVALSAPRAVRHSSRAAAAPAAAPDSQRGTATATGRSDRCRGSRCWYVASACSKPVRMNAPARMKRDALAVHHVSPQPPTRRRGKRAVVRRRRGLFFISR